MKNVLVVGAGHMGSALIESWVLNTKFKIDVLDPKKNNYILKKYKKQINYFTDIAQINYINKYQIIVFAVKPQIAKKVVIKFNSNILKNKLFISIIAGKKISFFEGVLSTRHHVVRTMPNLPAKVGKGVTAIFCNKNIKRIEKTAIKKLFKCIGIDIWLKKESDIDKITAISGSGPAYYYLFIELLIKASMKLGLNEALAQKIVLQTSEGSVDLLKSSKLSPQTLRKNIAVKGGTTEAAINYFLKKRLFEKIIFNSINSAYQKAKFIGKK